MKISIQLLGRDFSVAIAHKPEPKSTPTDEELQRKWEGWMRNTRNSSSPVIGFGAELRSIEYPHRRWNE